MAIKQSTLVHEHVIVSCFKFFNM